MRTIEEALEYIVSHDLYLSGSPIDDGKYVYKVSSRYFNIEAMGISYDGIVEATNDFIKNLVDEIAEVKQERIEHLAVLEKFIP